MRKLLLLALTFTGLFANAQAPKKWTPIAGNYEYLDSARFTRLKYYGPAGDSVLSTDQRGNVVLVKNTASGGSGDSSHVYYAVWPLYVDTAVVDGDTTFYFKIYGVDSSFIDARVVDDSTIRLYRLNKDSLDLIVKGNGGSGGAVTLQQAITNGADLTEDNTVTSTTGKTYTQTTTGAGSVFSSMTIHKDRIIFTNTDNVGGNSSATLEGASIELIAKNAANNAGSQISGGLSGSIIGGFAPGIVNRISALSTSDGIKIESESGSYYLPRGVPNAGETFIAGVGGVFGFGSANNFANTNLTATDDRIHDFNSHALSIDRLAQFKISNVPSVINWVDFDGGTMSWENTGTEQYLIVPFIDPNGVYAVISTGDTLFMPFDADNGDGTAGYFSAYTIDAGATCLKYRDITAGTPTNVIMQVAAESYTPGKYAAFFDGDSLKKFNFQIIPETLGTVLARNNTADNSVVLRSTYPTNGRSYTAVQDQSPSGNFLSANIGIGPPFDVFPRVSLKSYDATTYGNSRDFKMQNYLDSGRILYGTEGNSTPVYANTFTTLVFPKGSEGENFNLTLPKYSGVLTGKVNGISAGADGNVILPVGTGTVTAVSIASANGFTGSSSGGATPALTLSTSLTGLLKGNGSAMSAAVAGTDYLTPTGSAAGLISFPTLNQNTTGSAATWTTGRTIGITGDVAWTSPALNGSANVAAAATVTRINGTSLAGLATGIYKNTTGSGVPSIAVAADFPTLNQNTTGSAATITTPRLINGVSFNGSADIAVTNKLLAYQALGSTMLAQPVSGSLGDVLGSVAIANNRNYYTAVYLDKATTITGVKWKQVTTGVYTATGYNGVALFTYSGGNLTLVASSTNDATIWTATGNTIASKAFSSTYSAAAGLYFIGFTYNNSAQVTAPALGIVGASGFTENLITDFTNSAKLNGIISGSGVLANVSIAAITAQSTVYFVALY